AAEGRKCEGGAVGGSGRESVHDTTCDPLVEQNRWSGGAHNSLRVPRPDPPLLPLDHFPFGPAILRRRVQSGTCAWVRRNFSRGPAGRCDGEIGRASCRERVWSGGGDGPGEEKRKKHAR